MIDPNDVTKFDRTEDELLEFWLFCLFVRGKNADVQAKKLDAFVRNIRELNPDIPAGESLITVLMLSSNRKIEAALRACKAGQYTTLVKAISQTILHVGRYRMWLQTATVAELQDLDGVGPKTARFFVLHSRPGVRVAVLDTHILQYMAVRDGDGSIPKATPTGARYAQLEEQFLTLADYEEVDPAAFDLAIWRANRARNPLAWRDYL